MIEFSNLDHCWPHEVFEHCFPTFWSWVFADRESDGIIIWGPEITLQLTPMIFKNQTIWASHSSKKNCSEQDDVHKLTIGPALLLLRPQKRKNIILQFYVCNKCTIDKKSVGIRRNENLIKTWRGVDLNNITYWVYSLIFLLHFCSRECF